ncbi:gliding motility-associated C-terminal domain-containing protein [Rufibacter sp. LB8]|uniref:DUF7948 domain-containing protein n=1 Tax=Rufibacter sp. LB8 TaxID=2777781 RepID=UPI00178C8014|nr:gliding motility-associated C-terminal domain-containing protein [Rufibacter sp. LB8]
MMRCRVLLLLSVFLVAFAARASTPVPGGFAGFVQNKGQWAQRVLQAAELPQGWLFLEKTGFTYNFMEAAYFDLENEAPEQKTYQGHGVHVEFVNGNPSAAVAMHQVQPEYRNYYLGSNSANWATRASVSKEIRYTGVFPQIDFKIYGQQNSLKYDFVVQPGGQVAHIKMKYHGTSDLALSYGRLLVKTSVNEFMEEKPYAYQVVNGQRQEVPCAFTLQNGEVGFAITGAYNPRLPLVIDPELVFVSYSGSTSGISANSATADRLGNTYTASQTLGMHYPVTSGAYQTVGKTSNVAISKFNSSGTRLLFATYLGGSGIDYPLALLVSPNAELVVAGTTSSGNFPMSATAFDRLLGNGFGGADFFVTKLSEDGMHLLASTFLGGGNQEGSGSSIPMGLALDKTGNVLVASSTPSPDFPMVSPFQNSLKGVRNGVIAKLNSNLSALLFSSFVGGSGVDNLSDIKVGPVSGHLYVVGNTNSSNFPVTPGVVKPNAGGLTDGIALVVNPDQKTLVAATFLGTSNHDLAQLLTLDPQENVYVAGFTAGSYPVTEGTYRTAGAVGGQFIHKLNKTLTSSLFSTHIGNGTNPSNQHSIPTAFELDDCGNLYLTAYSVPGSPLTPNALQSARRNLYLAQLSQDARQLVYGSFFGGSVIGHIHYANHGYITKDGVFYHIECTTSKTFVATPGAFSGGATNSNDGVISKFSFYAGQDAVATVQTPTPGCAPYAVSFVNFTSGNNTYSWDFGDGSAPSTDKNPTHVFEKPGLYRVQLTTYNNNACLLISPIEVLVQVKSYLTAPNVITPNADGRNDTFVITNRGENALLRVYNRWGKLVFQDPNYQDRWDGADLVEGTYFYSIDAPNACEPATGWVEIIR